MKTNILIIDDEPGIRFAFSQYLEAVGHSVKAAADRNEAGDALLRERFDAVLLDINLPDVNGLDLLTELRAGYPEMAIVVITGHGDIPLAVEAMRRGADNFLSKPVNMAGLDVYLRKALEISALRRSQTASERLAKPASPFFGDSQATSKMLELATVAAANDSPVMLQGETGSGKGVLARWIHGRSARGRAPLVEVNCSGLRGELLASELFGHAKGSFTSAVADREGLIEVADGGTLFLDEIGDMDLQVQAQFLKVIEEKQYRRLGEVKVRRSEFRLICATNKDLMEEARQGRFRLDLYFRIFVFPIPIAPLRERVSELPGLVRHIMAGLGRPSEAPSPEVMRMLASYRWPGNIRELRNVVERGVLIARGGPLTPECFPGLAGSTHPDAAALPAAAPSGMPEEERIKSELERQGGDVVRTASALGISRATLYRRLKKLGIAR
ncbi:MAG: sigma-54-dependent Fis family transcriptional regulator [Nitrospirae bacterium]|nr:sigma-54-dependent Fis family transcriptional regulator [Nitrospirota bacterium]